MEELKRTEKRPLKSMKKKNLDKKTVLLLGRGERLLKGEGKNPRLTALTNSNPSILKFKTQKDSGDKTRDILTTLRMSMRRTLRK